MKYLYIKCLDDEIVVDMFAKDKYYQYIDEIKTIENGNKIIPNGQLKPLKSSSLPDNIKLVNFDDFKYLDNDIYNYPSNDYEIVCLKLETPRMGIIILKIVYLLSVGDYINELKILSNMVSMVPASGLFVDTKYGQQLEKLNE